MNASIFALLLALVLGNATLGPETSADRPFCEVKGTVLDRHGSPVPGLHVRLEGGNVRADTFTDTKGGYSFAAVRATRTGFDPNRDQVRVSIIAEDFLDPKQFRILVQRKTAALHSDRFKLTPTAECRRDFDLRTLPAHYTTQDPELTRWPALIELYQGFARAWTLARALGIQAGPAVEILAWEPSVDDTDTVFVGTPSYNADHPLTPQISLGPTASGLEDNGYPDNREYHEAGHLFLARALGTLPRHPDNQSHGGYAKNPTTTDAWVEGFSSFFALMVNKHVDRRRRPQMLLADGGYWNIELDYRPWGSPIFEELAVAGVLLDLEDGGDSAPAAKRLQIGEPKLVGNREPGLLLIARVKNLSDTPARFASVRARSTDANQPIWTDVATTIPDKLAMNQEGWVAFPVSADVDPARVALEPVNAGPDDDPVEIELSQIWRVITSFRSKKTHANGRLFDVEDLYHALHAAFAGDRDGDGVDDIDQIFVAHGLFADVDGDHRHAGPGETVGLVRSPSSTQRHRLPTPASTRVRVETTAPDPTIYVKVSLPEPFSQQSYGYVARRNADGTVTLAVPPPHTSAVINLVAVAQGEPPAIIGRITAPEFWSDPSTKLVFRQTQGDTGRTRSDRVPSPLPPRLVVFFCGLAAVFLGGIFMLSGRRRPARPY